MDIVPDSSGEMGNTNNHLPIQISPALHWFFTWNNYPDNWLELLKFHSSKISAYIFGVEVGASGTKHIQGNISFKTKTRPKNLFPKEIHWEKTKKLDSAVEYCSKEGEFYSKGYVLPYKCEISLLKDWQRDIIKILKEIPNDRTINWYWSQEGNIGKTTFCKYIYTHFDKVVVLGGKADDMKNGIVDYQKNNKCLPAIVLIDIPRCHSDCVSYSGIEQVKNMFFYSGKYEGGMICGEPPHIVCFANITPQFEKLSADRWNIVMI